MEIMSSINDYRINSLNLYVETTFGEYLQYARDLVKPCRHWSLSSIQCEHSIQNSKFIYIYINLQP